MRSRSADFSGRIEEIAAKRALIRRSAFSQRGANFSGFVSASAASEAAFHRSLRGLTCGVEPARPRFTILPLAKSGE